MHAKSVSYTQSFWIGLTQCVNLGVGQNLPHTRVTHEAHFASQNYRL